MTHKECLAYFEARRNAREALRNQGSRHLCRDKAPLDWSLSFNNETIAILEDAEWLSNLEEEE